MPRMNPQLYEHYDLRAISTRKVSFQCLYDVIPVLDTGIQLFHNHQNVVFLHKIATFMLTNLIKFLDPSVWALG
ncbi:hypothetical protein HCR13_02670 [Wolbachia pipientis]|nr:hypothetical protein [Wolbachia pipientis]